MFRSGNVPVPCVCEKVTLVVLIYSLQIVLLRGKSQFSLLSKRKCKNRFFLHQKLITISFCLHILDHTKEFNEKSSKQRQCSVPPLPKTFQVVVLPKMAADSLHAANEKDKLPERVVLWDETEVAEKQVNQVGTSACGATAVLNVLKLLGRSALVDMAVNAVNTRLRDLSAPLPQYLLSRSVAGTTHKDLIEGLDKLTNGEVMGRFFHMYPKRDFDLSSWLKYWLMNGVIPLATLNCQKVPLDDGTIPDAWHHQVICGVSENGVHLTNPERVSPFDVISKELCSESVLLIRRHDILQRWSNALDFSCWTSDGNKWNELEVREQIDQVVKEETLLLLHGSELKYRELLTTHIAIPAAYKSGITLFALRDSAAHKLLEHASELTLEPAPKEGDENRQSSLSEKSLSVIV